MNGKIFPAKSGILFGVLFGTLMVLEFIIVYLIGMKLLVKTSTGLVINMTNYIVFPILFISLGCKNYKNNINNGFITFGECLKIGVSITLIAALIYSIFNVVFNFITPNFINETIALTKEVKLIESPDMTKEELESEILLVKKFMNPLILIPSTLAMYSFIGLIYSSIIGLIIKGVTQST